MASLSKGEGRGDATWAPRLPLGSMASLHPGALTMPPPTCAFDICFVEGCGLGEKIEDFSQLKEGKQLGEELAARVDLSSGILCCWPLAT